MERRGRFLFTLTRSLSLVYRQAGVKGEGEIGGKIFVWKKR
jgi:hypothetical protein